MRRVEAAAQDGVSVEAEPAAAPVQVEAAATDDAELERSQTNGDQPGRPDAAERAPQDEAEQVTVITRPNCE